MKLKYKIGDTIWYIDDYRVKDMYVKGIKTDDPDSEELYDWYYTGDGFITTHDISCDKDIYPTELEAKKALRDIFKERIKDLGLPKE